MKSITTIEVDGEIVASMTNEIVDDGVDCVLECELKATPGYVTRPIGPGDVIELRL